MADPAMAASENITAISSPGFPRYFLQMSENSRTSPYLAERKDQNDWATSLLEGHVDSKQSKSN